MADAAPSGGYVFWRVGEEDEEGRREDDRRYGQTRRLDALRRASTASVSPVKHFDHSSKTEALASASSLKGALGAP
ncbi:hypothetical protein C1H46_027566 [Malus baccata]|uniref:Uncharacterized protein n=1 Tax=Malus baccata TaxID=106549 RepID=A0A540LK58_MALBA|nr:hypothetical protein C1H46_027566 [Malus baccata]